MTDLAVSLADRNVTVAEVLHALGLPAEGSTIDGAAVEAGDVLAVEALSAGAVIAGPDAPGVSPSGIGGPALVEVAVVAGLDAGAVTALHAGRYRLGQRPGHPRSGWYLAIDDPSLAAVKSRPWHEHATSIEAVTFPDAVLALGKPIDSEAGFPGHVHRPPRPLPPAQAPPIEIHEVPKEVSEPSPLSWATLLAPIPIALLMAFFFRPLFAIFAAMGPVVALGRWVEGKRKFKKDTKERNAKIAEMRAEVATAIREQAESAAELRWQNNPHPAELWRRARTRSVRLWERRPGAAGYLTVVIGVARDYILPLAGDGKPSPDVYDQLDEPAQVRTVPHVVDLAAHSGIGIHGDRAGALAVARSIVMQLVTLQGPADIKLGLVCADQAQRDWDWIKWLPHGDTKLIGGSEVPIIKSFGNTGGAKNASVSFNSANRQLGDITLVVVDDPNADVAAISRAATDAECDVRIVAVARNPTSLPAACSSLVEVVGTTAVISTPSLTGPRSVACATGLALSTAESWSRTLAPMSDPEVTEFTAGGSDAISLLQLVNFDSEDELRARWARRPPNAAAAAAVGVCDTGAFGIDLTEDGPHALVAGTTGSGKSEFLRTLVVALATECPPEHLNFVLVDFKGGGAFDICDRLPHIAGLITDLDEQLVVRAINSLRAELHRREHLFRDLGVSSYDEASVLASEPLARLVIVVDEFAALATDYSELMASIIDLAARGRSLGMHLVLATQRPSGVVDQKIRANTNLRVALRVQDAFDSQDVIGCADAAHIDRKSPGRAIFSIGGDSPVTVQTAYSGAPDVRSQRCTVQEFALFESKSFEPVSATLDAPQEEHRAEIDVLIEAIEAVSSANNYTARPLWPDPLPDALDWIDLGTRVMSAAEGQPSPVGGLPVGLVDLPDKQSQLPWYWDMDSGALVVYGASAECCGKILVSIGAALAEFGDPASAHLYMLDGDAGTIAALAGLAQCGAYVTIDEKDRIERTIGLFEKELATRRAAGDSTELPRMLLMIDNIASVLGLYDDMAMAAVVDRLGAIARDGAAQGLHMVVTARTPRDVSHKLAQQVPNRLVLSLADPNGYMTLGLKNADVVPLPSMRVQDLDTKRVVQMVEPPDMDTVERTYEIDPQRAPRPVLSFPTTLGVNELPPPQERDGVLAIPIGIESSNLDVAALVLQPGEHCYVTSPPGGGRSSMMCAIAQQIQRADIGITVYRLGAPGSPLLMDGWPGTVVTTVEEIESVTEVEGEVVILVDDADRLDEELAKVLEAITATAAPGLRVVAAATVDYARSMRAWTGSIRATNTAIMLGGAHTDGDVFKAKLTKLAGLGTIIGRGHLIVRGRVQPAHLTAPYMGTEAPA